MSIYYTVVYTSMQRQRKTMFVIFYSVFTDLMNFVHNVLSKVLFLLLCPVQNLVYLNIVNIVFHV